MIVLSLAKWRKRLKYALLFVALSYMLYVTLHMASEWLQPRERYRVPGGKAVKVIQQEAVLEESLSIRDRLLMFYRYGE